MNDAAVGSQAPRRGLVDSATFVLRWLKRRLLRRFKLAIPVVAVAALEPTQHERRGINQAVARQ